MTEKIGYPPRDDRDTANREFPTNGQENEHYRDPDTAPAVNRPLREAEMRYTMEQAARLRKKRRSRDF